MESMSSLKVASGKGRAVETLALVFGTTALAPAGFTAVLVAGFLGVFAALDEFPDCCATATLPTKSVIVTKTIL